MLLIFFNRFLLFMLLLYGSSVFWINIYRFYYCINYLKYYTYFIAELPIS